MLKWPLAIVKHMKFICYWNLALCIKLKFYDPENLYMNSTFKRLIWFALVNVSHLLNAKCETINSFARMVNNTFGHMAVYGMKFLFKHLTLEMVVSMVEILANVFVTLLSSKVMLLSSSKFRSILIEIIKIDEESKYKTTL